MDHSGRKVCIMVRYKTYVTTMLSAQSFTDSPQSPQHVAKPQDIEGGRWRGGGEITVRAQIPKQPVEASKQTWSKAFIEAPG